MGYDREEVVKRVVLNKYFNNKSYEDLSQNENVEFNKRYLTELSFTFGNKKKK